MNLDNENPNPPELFERPKTPLSLKVGTVACLVFLVIGLLAGGWIGSRLGPIRVVTKTVTVHESTKAHPKTPGVAENPQSCADAFTVTQKLYGPIDQYTSASQEQRDIASSAWIAITTKDYKMLVDVQSRQNKLNNNLSGPSHDIQEWREALDRDIKDCQKDLGR